MTPVLLRDEQEHTGNFLELVSVDPTCSISVMHGLSCQYQGVHHPPNWTVSLVSAFRPVYMSIVVRRSKYLDVKLQRT